jgi:hypothetical protein
MQDPTTHILGSQYSGRRYLRYRELEALGICNNRNTLTFWIRKGRFPAGIKISGPYGKTLVWSAVEVAQHLLARAAEREQSQSNERKTPPDTCPAGSMFERARVEAMPDAQYEPSRGDAQD